MRGTISCCQTSRILVVDDHPVVRSSIRGLLELHPDLEVCGVAESAAQTWAALHDPLPDLILMDLALGSEDGVELLRDVLAAHPSLRVLVLSIHSECLFAEAALKAGASGYIMKSDASDHLVEAIRDVLTGRVYLSPTFREHVKWKARGRVDRRRSHPAIFPSKEN